MEIDRPGPGEELNTGAVVVPRVAASVIVLRDSPAGPEVLLVQRNPESRFMGGAWVFPGGAVSASNWIRTPSTSCTLARRSEPAGRAGFPATFNFAINTCEPAPFGATSANK